VTASEARKRLFPLIEQVNEDREPVEITSRRGDAVLVAKSAYRPGRCAAPRIPSSLDGEQPVS
jgi:prevent-host-death family protein